MNLDTIDPTFRKDLLDSLPAVQIAADWWRSRGYEVIVPGLRVRPDVSLRFDYSDDGDLWVAGKGRMEVKHRKNLEFGGIMDYPYPSVMVDCVHSYDKTNPRPVGYMIFNRPISCFLYVSVNRTKAHWYKERKFCKSRGRSRDLYFCPLNLCIERAL